MATRLPQRAVRLWPAANTAVPNLRESFEPHGGRRDIDVVLDDLERGLFPPTRVLPKLPRSHGDRPGGAKLPLKAAGGDAGTVDAQIAAAAGLPDEIERPGRVWARKFRPRPTPGSGDGRRFLQSCGFSADVTRCIILKQIED